MTLQTNADASATDWQVAQYYGWGVNGLRQAWTPLDGEIDYAFDPQGNVSSRYTDTRRRTEGGSGWGAARIYDAYGQLRFGDAGEAQSDAVGYNGQWGYYTDIASLAASGNGLGSEAAQAGLVLCTYRYYSPDLARWLTRDPLGYEGGINVYAYCEDNPIGNVDPMGTFWSWKDVAHFAATTGAWAAGEAAAGPVGAALASGLVEGLWAYYVDHQSFEVAFGRALTTAISGYALSRLMGVLMNNPAFQNFLKSLGSDASNFFSRLVQRLARKAEGCAEGGGTCFVAGTLVQTVATGANIFPTDASFEPMLTATKPIEQVKIGDLVVSRDEATGKTSAKRVTGTKVRTAYELIILSFADAAGKVVETIQVTPEHPFYVDGKGFTPAGRLGIGNSIVTRAGPALTIKQLEHEARPEGVTVYNFTVEGDHTYFIGNATGGLWVHNYPVNWPFPSVIEEASAENVIKGLSKQLQEIYLNTIAKLAKGDLRGLHDHALSGEWKGYRAIDIPGIGKGRGSGRAIYYIKNGVITIVKVITDHKY